MNVLKLVECSREVIRITDDAMLVIFKDDGFEDAGVLKFKNGYEVEFRYDEDARQVFEDLEGADPIELITLLAQAPVQIRG